MRGKRARMREPTQRTRRVGATQRHEGRRPASRDDAQSVHIATKASCAGWTKVYCERERQYNHI